MGQDRYRPSREEFRELATKGNVIPVAREIWADMETPVSAFQKIARGPYAFLLESVEGGERWGRYSFLGAEPAALFRCHGQEMEIRRGRGAGPGRGRAPSGPGRRRVEDPVEALRAWLDGRRAVVVPGLPRFAGGAVGYLGYDMVRFMERLPAKAPDELGYPEAVFMLAETLVAFDNVRHTMMILANAEVREGEDPDTAYGRACEAIERLVARLRAPGRRRRPVGEGTQAVGPEAISNLSREAFEERVRRAKEHIFAGDAIQIVLSRRIDAPAPAEPFDLYRALRVVNPSPYMFYLRLGDTILAGASPEVLVRVEDGTVHLRPIAGTRPRGGSPEEDAKLAADLLADPKELAEHIMLVDLARNDLGRIAEIGTVRVGELMGVERYSHVMHIVSHVEGRLRRGLDSFDVLRASFPAGTVTGAPKIRAMEIIEDLEPCRRGPYAGAVGYLGFTGNCDFCITIRTAMIRQGRLSVQTGAGIVADSDPAREFIETENKARAMLVALDRARRGFAP